MALFGAGKSDQLAAWRVDAQSELARLQSLTPVQVATEVMSRGFSESQRPGDRRHLDQRLLATNSSIANMLAPDPPTVLKGDDLALLEQFSDFADESLQALEHASLILQKQSSSGDGTFYTSTRSGQAALEAGQVEAILAKGSQG